MDTGELQTRPAGTAEVLFIGSLWEHMGTNFRVWTEGADRSNRIAKYSHCTIWNYLVCSAGNGRFKLHWLIQKEKCMNYINWNLRTCRPRRGVDDSPNHSDFFGDTVDKGPLELYRLLDHEE